MSAMELVYKDAITRTLHCSYSILGVTATHANTDV